MMKIRLYAADVGVLTDPILFAKAKSMIDPARLEKTERIRPEEEKRRSVAAGLLLRFGLWQAGIRPDQQKFTVSANKKPCLIGEETVCFNLSHSGEVVLLAVSSSPVGCDVQKKEKMDLRIAERFYHPLERAWVMREKDPEKQNDRMHYIWNRKESVVKTSGSGLLADLTAFSVLEEKVLPGPYYLRDVRIKEGYCASVCSMDSILLGIEEQDPGKNAAGTSVCLKNLELCDPTWIDLGALLTDESIEMKMKY